MSHETNIATLQEVCVLLSKRRLDSASLLLGQRYPFAPVEKAARRYTPREMTAVFVKDGFIDRYRGTRLIFPPALRLISRLLPNEFPYHKNWKMSECHMAYWELLPTIDHTHSVGRGGANAEDNWISCSMLTNSIKSGWTLDQLGWKVLPPGNILTWDGMLSWFVERVHDDQSILAEPYFKRWHSAALEHVA